MQNEMILNSIRKVSRGILTHVFQSSNQNILLSITAKTERQKLNCKLKMLTLNPKVFIRAVVRSTFS